MSFTIAKNPSISPVQQKASTWSLNYRTPVRSSIREKERSGQNPLEVFMSAALTARVDDILATQLLPGTKQLSSQDIPNSRIY